MRYAPLYFSILAFIVGIFAFAGNDTIPTRSNGQTITAEWANVLKRVLSQDLLPRNSSGVVVDKAGSLGSSTYNWTDLNTEAVKLRQPGGSNQITLAAPSPLPSAYPITLPSALPASDKFLALSSAGALKLNSEIGTDQIANGSVTQAKLGTANLQISSSGGIQTSSATYVDVTGLTATITNTTGRPILLIIQSGNGGLGDSFVGAFNNSGASTNAEIGIRFVRDSTTIAESLMVLRTSSTSVSAIPHLVHLDNPGAGTYVYKVQTKLSVGSLSIFSDCKLVAVEL